LTEKKKKRETHISSRELYISNALKFMIVIDTNGTHSKCRGCATCRHAVHHLPVARTGRTD